MKVTFNQILNAFQPAKEITEPKRFSGRKHQITKSTELLVTGDHIFIYGPPGIGKSSITHQLKLIAAGNSILLETLDSDLDAEHLDYATCYLVRDSSINNINQLLYRLLIDSDCFAKFSYIFEEFGKTPNSYSQNIALDPNLVSDFWAKATTIAKKHKNGLAIFIDEFELIQHHDGFSSFLKAGKQNIIFIITGIGSTETDLIRDHSSIGRQLATGKIQLPVMSNLELMEVIQNSENSIAREICFTSEAANKLATVVRGQPYLLHLIGRLAFTIAFKAKSNTVDEIILDKALASIATDQIASTLERRYLKAIGNSPQREIVLRVFAESCDPRAHTSEVYKLATELGVTNPSYYTGDLQKSLFGEELRKDAEQYYSFKDQLFQAYVLASPFHLGRDSASQISENGIQNTKIKKITDFDLLHFSDIHFGPNHYFSELPAASDSIPISDKPTFDSTIIETLIRNKIVPNLIVASGDFTQNGVTSEFNIAAKSLNSISDHFTQQEIRPPDFIICPGNHDVNWASLKADPEAKYMAFQAYIAFRNKLLNTRKIDSGINPERIYEIVKLNTSPAIFILTLNSAVIESEDDHRGYIGQTQLNNALKELELIDDVEEAIKIAVFHHHLVAVPSIDMHIRPEGVMADSPFVKQRLHQAGFSLVLHGHRHQSHAEQIISDSGNGMLVIGCGSSGVIKKERAEQPLQFNHLLFSIQKSDIEIEIVTYAFDSSIRSWCIPSNSVKRTFAIKR